MDAIFGLLLLSEVHNLEVFIYVIWLWPVGLGGIIDIEI